MPTSRCAHRTVCSIGFALALLAALPSLAQQANPIGLNASRLRAASGCAITSLGCQLTDESVYLYSATRVGSFWGAQLGTLEMGPLARTRAPLRAQGLNVSLFGRTAVWNSFGLYGKLGASYGRSDTTTVPGLGPAALGETGYGLSWGAGMSYAFTPRLSAVLEWDSHDLRFGTAGRDPVRAASLGLQYRY